MKKTKFMIPILSAIVIGLYLGNVVYVNYQSNLDYSTVLKTENTGYFLQQGIYSSKESMQENTKNLTDYIYVLEEDKYKVFVGISSNINTSSLVKDIYNDKGINIYVKEMYISDSAYYEKLKEYDKLIDNSNDNNKILKIEEQIMKEYEALMKNE